MYPQPAYCEICRFSQSSSLVSVLGDAKHFCDQSNDRDHNPDADKPIDHYFYMVHVHLLVIGIDEACPASALNSVLPTCVISALRFQRDDHEIPLPLVFSGQEGKDP